MAMSPETAAWLEDLKKEGSLDDAAFNTLKATFDNDKVSNFVKGSVLRQADYSRNMGTIQTAQQAVADAQAALATREAAVTSFQTELGTWQAGAKVNFDKAIQEREKADRVAQAAVARLKSLAAANGLAEADVLKDIEVVPVVEKKAEQQVDTSKFVSREDIQRGVIESALGEATIADISDEVFALSGKRFSRKEFVTDAVKSGKTLEQFAEEKFGLAKLRTDKVEADYQARLKADTDAAVTARLSEAGIPGNLAPGRQDLKGSPVLMGGGVKMPAPGQQAGGGVPGAVAAFQGGKYATKQ